MVLDKLLHVILRQVVGFDVSLHELLVGDGSQVGQLFQLHEELLEIQLHQCSALVAAFLHVGVTAEERGGERSREGTGDDCRSSPSEWNALFMHAALFSSVKLCVC